MKVEGVLEAVWLVVLVVIDDEDEDDGALKLVEEVEVVNVGVEGDEVVELEVELEVNEVVVEVLLP